MFSLLHLHCCLCIFCLEIVNAAGTDSSTSSAIKAFLRMGHSPLRVSIVGPVGQFLENPLSPFKFEVHGHTLDQEPAIRACASFHILGNSVPETACTSTPLHAGQIIEMQSPDLFVSGSQVTAFVVLEESGRIVAAARTQFSVNESVTSDVAHMVGGLEEDIASDENSKPEEQTTPALTLNDYVKQANSLRVVAELALRAHDAAVAKYKISEAETMAISGLTSAGSMSGVSIAWLTHAFVAILGERSRYWEILGHWEILLQSYQAIPDEVDIASSLIGRNIPIPAWIRINNATSLPRVTYRKCRTGTCDEKERSRFVTASVALSRFEDGIKFLLDQDLVLDRMENPSTTLIAERRLKVHHSRLHRRLLSSGFYLAYLSVHRGSKDAKRLLSSLHRRILKHSDLSSPPTTKLPKSVNTTRLRVGFASKVLLSDHSISRLLKSTLCDLANNFHTEVELFVVILDPKMSPSPLLKYCHSSRVTGALPGGDSVNLVEGGGTLESARNALLQINLDVLVYPAIGMDFITTLLANMRLAPVQGVWWGHPDSSGSSEIDVFFTSDLAESRRKIGYHYSEHHLARMSGLGGFSMDDPALLLNILPSEAGIDAALALHKISKSSVLEEVGLKLVKKKQKASKITLYICGQPHFKLHPSFFDRVIAEILLRDSSAYFVLLRDNLDDITERTAERLSYAISKDPNLQKKLNREQNKNRMLENRVHFIRRRSRADFLRLMAAADVVLDTFPFGGGVTTLEALSVGAPVVTLPDPRYLRGRLSQHYIHYLGDKSLVRALVIDSSPMVLEYENLLQRMRTGNISKEDEEMLSNDDIDTLVPGKYILQYARKSVSAAKPNKNEKLRMRIIERKHRIFNDKSAAKEWVNWFKNLTRKIS